MPRRQLTINQGATFQFSFQVLADSSEGCLPRDLSGWTARMQIRPSYESESVVLSLDSSGGITINESEGRVLLEASSDQTAAIPAPAAYVYDIEGFNTSNGVVERWLEGVVRVSPEVTR